MSSTAILPTDSTGGHHRRPDDHRCLPQRFGRVLALDRVTPLGLLFNAEQIGLFRAMMKGKELTPVYDGDGGVLVVRAGDSRAARRPRFREGLGEIQALFERIVEQTFGVSEDIWIGTPVNLTRERESRGSSPQLRMAELDHPHWCFGVNGRLDCAGRSPDGMAAAMPDCRLLIVPSIGHSMNFSTTGALCRLFRCLVRRRSEL